MATPNNTSPSPSNLVNPDRQAAEKLRSWVQKNKNLLEILLDAYCIVDLQNRVVDFNVAFTDLCGESYRKIVKIGEFCQLVTTEYCPHQCPARTVVDTRKPIRLDELKGHSKNYPELQLILAGVPLLGDDNQVLGSLITMRNVSAESELQKKYDEKKKDSVTDGLTRLFNKVHTEGALLRLVKGTLREVKSFSIAMVDIDHFKKVNDTYGHQAGDYVLSLVAQMLKGETRDTDMVGRFGGGGVHGAPRQQ